MPGFKGEDQSKGDGREWGKWGWRRDKGGSRKAEGGRGMEEKEGEGEGREKEEREGEGKGRVEREKERGE